MPFLLRRIFLLWCLLLAGFAASAVTASFTADYTVGCAPLVVNFTNTSSGATSYSWDFGNGSGSALTSPSTSYLAPGTYTVTLTASGGGSASTQTMVITVRPNPTVAFHADMTSVCPGTPVTFTSTSVAGVPGGMTYLWNFGDGSTGTTSPVVYTYNTPGNYNVTLAVTNSQGCTSNLTQSGYIHVFTPAVPDFTVSAAFFCNPPATITFNNTSTGTPPLSYQWTFGDGSPVSATSSPTHTYASDGWYTVKLVVTDGNGCKDSIIRNAYIHISSSTASFSSAATVCVGNSISFTNTSMPHTSSSWTFGDGGTDTANNPAHIYSAPGTYNVTLTVSDGTCTATVSHSVTVLPSPTGTFTISPTNSCPAPATISYNASVATGTSVSWLYGDGGTGSGASSSHTYTGNGVDTVKMILTDGNGCKDTVKQVFMLYDLYADINHDTIASGCAPLPVHFTAHVWTLVPDSIYHVYPFGVASCTWNFGDGSPTFTSSSTVTDHTFMTPGTYTVTLHVVTTNGCTKDATLTVLVGTRPHAAFTALPTHICSGKWVNFVNTSTGADSYVWFFGDGNVSYATSPIDTYRVPGIYTVMLIALDRGCPDTMIRTDYIQVDSPMAQIFSTPSCTPRTLVNFADSSLGDDTHLWIFGDGATSTDDNPAHTFPALDIYTVSLATYNAASGCRDTQSIVVNLTPPTMSFTADDTAICRDDHVKFYPVVSPDHPIHWWWSVNGVYIADSMRFVDTFHTTGLYSIRLVIQDDHHCYDTLIKNNYILVAKPVAHFNTVPPTGCWPLAVTFTDASTDVPGTFFTNYAWTFGDGGTASVATVSVPHTYTAVGTFGVKEIVTDNIGCKDTVTIPNDVTVYRPQASFYVNTTHPCRWATTVYFSNTSTGGVASSFWSFGDGATSTLMSPTHVYTATGSYTVKLVVTDSHGCTDTLTQLNYMNVNAPVAAFTPSDTFSICAPLVVHFTNTSTGATSYIWSFGDSNGSTAVSPSDIYTSSGIDTAMLIAINPYGCRDTAVRYINLYGYAGALTGCAPLTVHFHASISNVPSIKWDFADGSVSAPSAIDSIDHVYTTPGAYVPKLILSDGTGCQNSSVGLDTIKVDAVYPGIDVSPAVCLNGTFHFVDSSTSYWSAIASWQWTFNGTTSTASSPECTYTTVGTYPVTLQVTDAWGCTGTISESFTVSPPPVITASPDTTICLGDYASLSATGGVAYTWASAATVTCVSCNPTAASPSVATTYTVTGTDASGCPGTDTATVFLRMLTLSHAWGDTAVCPGVGVPLFDTGGTSYTWIPATGLSDPHSWNPVATPSNTTNYMVIAQLAGCRPDTNMVKVVVSPNPQVHAGDDQMVLAGSDVELGSSGSNIASYQWAPPAQLSCDSCANPVATMSVTTTFTVDVLSDQGCHSEDSVRISVYCATGQIFMPNSFTPNGDGQNDVYYPRGKGISVVKTFRIYNRWGELLFERENFEVNDPTQAWNGWYKDGSPRADVYVWLLEAVCYTGEPLFLKGDVTIIR